MLVQVAGERAAVAPGMDRVTEDHAVKRFGARRAGDIVQLDVERLVAKRGGDALGDLCRLTFGRVEHQQDLRHGSMMTTTASASQGRRSLGTTAPNRARAAAIDPAGAGAVRQGPP